MIKGKARARQPGHARPMFDEAPTLAPYAALLTGAGIIIGGLVLFSLTLALTRWLARR